MSTNLTRIGSGLAALLGGVLGAIASVMALVFLLPPVLSHPSELPSLGIIIILPGLLLILGWVLVLGGLVGLYASQREAIGALGTAGFMLALIGTVLLVVVLCAQTFFLSASGPTGMGTVESLVAVVVVLVNATGWFLFGLGTFMARMYPRPAAMLLMIGAAISAFIHLTGGEFIIIFASIAWFGFFLLRGGSSLGEAPSHMS